MVLGGTCPNLWITGCFRHVRPNLERAWLRVTEREKNVSKEKRFELANVLFPLGREVFSIPISLRHLSNNTV